MYEKIIIFLRSSSSLIVCGDDKHRALSYPPVPSCPFDKLPQLLLC